jgi:hypothetical protein
LSYIGGLLGLFAGFSVLSFVELVYWLSIKEFLKRFGNSSSKVVPFIELSSHRTKRFRILRSYIEKYLNESSIHGLSYISDGKFIQR